MKIVAISDTHGFHDNVRIPKCDLLIHAGDISKFGDEAVMPSFMDWLRKSPARETVLTCGNHDSFIQENENKYRFAFPTGCRLLLHEETRVAGIKIFGSPWTPWFHEWAYNFPKGDLEFARKAWSLIPDDTEILITHGPPAGILDTSRGDFERNGSGCPMLAARIKELKSLRLHVFGHIHESHGRVDKDGVTYINASLVNSSRKPVNSHVVFDW